LNKKTVLPQSLSFFIPVITA